MAIPRPTTLPRRLKDLTGMRFGRLLVLSYDQPHQTKGHKWLCRCDCGSVGTHETRCLARGDAKSCGCLKRELVSARFSKRVGGRKGTTRAERPLEHGSYQAMMQRCHCPTHKDYHYYGARGRTVCDRWRFGDGIKSGFDCFLEDMPPRPSYALTLDRIDNNGNYEPGNCRWATKEQQTLNR